MILFEKIKAGEEDQPSFLSSKDSKAAKVATLSQALDQFDQFRKSQRCVDQIWILPNNKKNWTSHCTENSK